MHQSLNRYPLKHAMMGVVSAFATSMAIPSAMAQQSTSGEQSISIEAQSLGEALIAISDAFNITVLATEQMVAGKKAPTVSGNYSAQAAINALLEGTGLEAKPNQTGDYLVTVSEAAPVERPILSPEPTSPPEPDAPLISETIVVTGQKLERSLQDTKESVSVVTAAELEELSLLDVQSVLLQTPNIAITRQGTRDFSIRGISRGSASTGGVGELAVTFYDGVAIVNNATSFVSPNLWDVEQVEVFRGPQSTNVGRNALAGAIVIKSNEPNPDEFATAARIEYGNLETYAVEGMVNIPVTSNSALRITAERNETEGAVENDNLNDKGAAGTDYSSIRARYLVDFTDRLQAIATLQYGDGEFGVRAYNVADEEPLDRRLISSDTPDRFTYEGFSGSLSLKYDLSERWDVLSMSTFLDGEFNRVSDIDLTPTPLSTFLIGADEQNFSQELRATYNGDQLRGVLGGYFLQIESENFSDQRVGFTPATTPLFPEILLPFYPEVIIASQSSDSEAKITNTAAFTQWEYDVVDQVTVSAGLRYDRESRDFLSFGAPASVDPSTPLPDPVAAGDLAEMMTPGTGSFVSAGVAATNSALGFILASEATEARFDLNYDALLPEFGVTYRITPEANISGFYKRGYRAGGAQTLFDRSVNVFEPEYLDNFELSLRSEWLDGALLVNANTYYGIWTDQQINVPIDGNDRNTRTTNAGESRIWGIELQTDYVLSKETRVFANAGYANTEFKDFCSIDSNAEDLPDCTSGGVIGKDLAGNDFASSPDWTAAVGVRHTFDKNFFAQINATYQDGLFSNVENDPEFETDDFTLINASVGYISDTFEVTLYGRNLLDEFYATRFARASFGGALSVFSGPPREFGVIVSARF